MGRKKIWKSCGVIFVIVLVLGAVSYSIFKHVAVSGVSSLDDSALRSEIAQEIQKIKEKGEPSSIEELVPEEIPDNENASHT